MPSWSEVGVHNHPTGDTCLTSSGEMPMSQVSPSLGLEVWGRGDSKHHHLASLLRLQPAGATSKPIFWPRELLGQGESAADPQNAARFYPAQSASTEPDSPLLLIPPASGPLHLHFSFCWEWLSFLSSELFGFILSTIFPGWAATAPASRHLSVPRGAEEQDSS